MLSRGWRRLRVIYPIISFDQSRIPGCRALAPPPVRPRVTGKFLSRDNRLIRRHLLATTLLRDYHRGGISLRCKYPFSTFHCYNIAYMSSTIRKRKSMLAYVKQSYHRQRRTNLILCCSYKGNFVTYKNNFRDTCSV